MAQVYAGASLSSPLLWLLGPILLACEHFGTLSALREPMVGTPDLRLIGLLQEDKQSWNGVSVDVRLVQTDLSIVVRSTSGSPTNSLASLDLGGTRLLSPCHRGGVGTCSTVSLTLPPSTERRPSHVKAEEFDSKLCSIPRKFSPSFIYLTHTICAHSICTFRLAIRKAFVDRKLIPSLSLTFSTRFCWHAGGCGTALVWIMYAVESTSKILTRTSVLWPIGQCIQ